MIELALSIIYSSRVSDDELLKSQLPVGNHLIGEECYTVLTLLYTCIVQKNTITTASKLVLEVQSTERTSLLHLTVVKVFEPALILFAQFE